MSTLKRCCECHQPTPVADMRGEYCRWCFAFELSNDMLSTSDDYAQRLADGFEMMGDDLTEHDVSDEWLDEIIGDDEMADTAHSVPPAA